MQKLLQIAKKARKPKYKILPLFTQRWSPRSMTGKQLSDKELMPLFEAARWAPSSFNNQPWRFIIAKNKQDKAKFMKILGEWNQNWCKNASILGVIISRKKMEYKERPNPTHSFDTGSAWMSLALEGARRGLVVHGMAGFDYDKAKKDLKIPNTFQVEAMFAIGKLADKNKLPEDYQKQEIPSQRKQISEILMEGSFK